MKNTEKTNFWDKNLISPMREVVTRFPFALITFVIFVLVSSYLIITETDPDTYIASLLTTLGTAGILFVAGRLFVEKFTNKNTNWIYAIIILYSLGFYFFGTLYLEHNFILFVLHIAGFTAFPFWISYSLKEKNDFSYYNFFRSALGAILIGIIIGGIISILGVIAITAVHALFDISGTSYWKFNLIWIIISFFILGISYALARFPKYHTLNTQIFEEDKTSNFIIKFIFVPFTILYFIILYAYSFKVLINFFDWPKGIIANMVMGFSFLAYFTYILSKSLENSSFVKIFRKILPWAIFLQIFMLFYAIFLRINQYGLTTNRYIVVIAGFALLGLSLYYIISSRKRLVIIPATFSILALFFSIGPWNVQELPWKIQFERFKNNLTEVGALQNEKIIPIEKEKVSYEKIEEIRSQIYYLCGWGICDQRFVNFVKSSLPNDTIKDTDYLSYEVINLLGITGIYSKASTETTTKYFSGNNANNAIDVSDYDIFLPYMRISTYNSYDTENTKIFSDFSIEISTTELIIRKNELEERFSLKPLYEQLKDKNPSLSQNIHFDIDGQFVKIQLLFNSITIDTEEKLIVDGSFNMLIDEK